MSVAHYDHHRDLVGNGTKAPVIDEGDDEPQRKLRASYDEARREQAWVNPRRKKLEHARDIGNVLRADRLNEGLQIARRTIQSELNLLKNRADDLALAVSKEGTSGARQLLRRIATELGNNIADALSSVAATLPAEDEPAEELSE